LTNNLANNIILLLRGNKVVSHLTAKLSKVMYSNLILLA
jgi:hypothetical protein